MDLQSGMRDILMRNGMQAHIVANGDKYQLAVQGHDSPLLRYDLTEKQLLALTDWGTNTANKKAWNVFTSIVAGDFDMPKNLVHARNANGRVAMGLHGYRVGDGEYGRRAAGGPAPRGMWGPSLLGWTPRQQDGMHLRRVGGQVFYQPPMVAERPDGRMKPGELQSGSYGFYYRGGDKQAQTEQQSDVLQDLQSVITPITQTPRSTDPAVPYKELITSDVYFSNEKWQEALSSHGLVIDPAARTLTVQSSGVPMDMVYDLTDEELKALTDNSIKSTTVKSRLDIINNVISGDFQGQVTMDALNSKDRISIDLRPEVLSQLTGQQQYQQQTAMQDARQDIGMRAPQAQDGNRVDGRDLAMENANKGWYREGRHGREVEVTDISVHGTDVPGKYVMSAVIDGEAISHEISQKQYDKFLALDDYHRMKLFGSIFDEVDMKTRPGANAGLGNKILAAVTAGLVVTGEVVRGINRPLGPDAGPDGIHADPAHPRVYYKPGVDSPSDIAARNFEAMANQTANDIRNGRGI